METPPANHTKKNGQAREEERRAPFPWQAGDLEGPAWWPEAEQDSRSRAGWVAAWGGGGGGAGRAPTTHVILPQASLSGFLGCNWSCPACEPLCQAELSEWGKGEEGWIPAPSPCSLCTWGGEGSPSTRHREAPWLWPSPAWPCLPWAISSSPSPLAPAPLLSQEKGPQTQAQPVTASQRLGLHAWCYPEWTPAPGPLPSLPVGLAQSLPSSRTSIHQAESCLSCLVAGGGGKWGVPPAEAAELLSMLPTGQDLGSLT